MAVFGIDSMDGGTGNDTYIVNDVRDKIYEGQDYQYGDYIFRGGIDTVETSVSGYVLADNVENLKLRSNAITGTGNDLNNYIQGNYRSNTINGGKGDDLISGGLGSDRLRGGSGSDHLIGIHSTSGYEVDRLSGGSHKDYFHLYNVINGTGQTYDYNSYAIIEDFRSYELDRIWVLGSQSEFHLDKTVGDFLGGGGNDTLIKHGTNIIGVVENNINVNFGSFDFIGG